MTTLALDHWIFGNGHGMATPCCDGRFYWMNGELYTFMQGFGAQLHSYQWTHPRPQERRKLAGYEFRPFRSERRWGRVEVAWAVVNLPDGIDAANAFLREMETRIGRL